eukprot:COSAG02_NODE_515_length_20817_cov_61.106960_9_plen_68_part_00
MRSRDAHTVLVRHNSPDGVRLAVHECFSRSAPELERSALRCLREQFATHFAAAAGLIAADEGGLRQH